MRGAKLKLYFSSCLLRTANKLIDAALYFYHRDIHRELDEIKEEMKQLKAEIKRR